MGVFKDFIPEGEDRGALGSGFVDFVPTPEQKPVEEVKEVVEKVEESVSRGKQKKG